MILGSFLGCQPARLPGPALGTAAPGGVSQPGVTELGPGEAVPSAAGRTVYVPVYSHVYTGDAATPFDLALTLSARNTDRAEPIVLKSVRYHDNGGKLVRDYLKTPLRLAPLAAMEFFVRQNDVTGGSSASFVVEWSAAMPVSEPVVEAVMIGTATSRAIALISPGRVVAEGAEGR
jgi:hypothetical protein